MFCATDSIWCGIRNVSVALEWWRMLFGRLLHCGCLCTAQAASALEKFGGGCLNEITAWTRSIIPVWACKLSHRRAGSSRTFFYLVRFSVITEYICGSDTAL